MFNFFKRQKSEGPTPIFTDIHSHLLPDLDDGVENFEEALDILQSLSKLGYKKIITTPHIMSDFYRNTPANILAKLKELTQLLKENNLNIIVEAAAEYYLDDDLMEKIDNGESELLTFGDNYLLFETSFMNQPFYLNEFIFKAKSRGLNPILAHPERYAYLQSNPDMIDDLLLRGVLLQLNINSLSGYYSKPVQKMAHRLVDEKKIAFLGSDCHNKNHLKILQKTMTQKYYKKALSLPLLNNNL